MFSFKLPSSKKTFLYLDRRSLSILTENGQLQSKVNFPVQVVSYLNVLDSVMLEKILINFLRTQKLNKSISLVLSSKLLFNAKVPTSLLQKPEELSKIFLSNIPFPPQNIVTRHVNSVDNKETVLMGTNRKYYQVIVKGLVDFGLKVEVVIPEVAFELLAGKKIPFEMLPAIIKKERKLVEQVNYLD